MTRWTLLLICALLAACASAPNPPTKAAAALLDDSRFGPPTEHIDTPAEVFALTDEMRHYLKVELAATLRNDGRQRGLLDALYRRGSLKLEYDASDTRNAADTFTTRRGNCLALVIMTAALAKELDLQVDYRSAYTEETWSRLGDIYFLSGHVNLTLGQRMMDTRSRADPTEYTIDFLPPEQLRGLRTQSISERTVLAMYMNNRAAEALARSQLDNAYAWVRAAIHQHPGFANAYNTLGVVYMRHGDLALATNAFREVLAQVPQHLPAMTNLARAYDAQGMVADAAALRLQLAKLEPYPPFHYFQLGREAAARGDWRAARDWFAMEVQRADYSAEFHYWLGLSHYQLGNLEAAKRHLALAAENSITRGDQALYAAKLAWLKQVRLVVQ
ncbi:MAG: hypothetical protein HY021_02910 [Burkholderiales bacterium]|nr:hypothetical protein [Burkholderiales bacterium]